MMKLNKKPEKPSIERMGTEPIPKLLMSMAGPAIISMVIQSAYNVVDSMFAAKINKEALVAVTLAYPVELIIGAMSTGIGIGVNSAVSRRLGSKEKEEAEKAAANGLFLGLFVVTIMVLFGLFGAGLYIRNYTNDAKVITGGIQYVRIVSIGCIGGVFTQLGFSILQGSGNMTYSMYAQVASVLLNTVMDPILIFVCHLDVAGAALSTVIAQCLSMAITFYCIFKQNRENLHVKLKGFRPDFPLIGDILIVGIPAALTQATTSVVTTVINKMIVSFGTDIMAVYGAYCKLNSFVTLPIFGITRGMNPIIGYSYGAKDKKRFLETERLAKRIAFGWTMLAFLVFMLLPNALLHLMSATDEMLAVGIPMFRVLTMSIPVVGLSIVMQQIFYPIKKSYVTMSLTIMRQVVFLVPAMYFLSKAFGYMGLWYGQIFADYISVFIVYIVNRVLKRREINRWPEQPIPAHS